MEINESIKIDFTEADLKPSTGSYEAMSPGDYKAFITEIEMSYVSNPASKNFEKPYFTVQATISEEEEKYSGRKIYFSVMLFSMEKGNWFLASFLRACGMEDRLESGVISTDPEDYLGCEVVLKVKKVVDTYRQKKLDETDEWDGKPIYKNEVNNISAANEDKISALNSKSKKADASPKPKGKKSKKSDYLPI